MHICYLDESGGCEADDSSPSATPVMVLAGLVVDAAHVPALTRDFLALKRRFFPARFHSGPALDHILEEVKGSEILQMTRHRSRDKRRMARLFRNDVLSLLEEHDCRVVGRVWVKAAGKALSPTASYCYAVQDIARHFGEFLTEQNSEGVIVADGRVQSLNIKVAHSIFTQKWRTGGDPFGTLRDVPLFAHSDNHAGIQLADLLASTLVFPMAASAFGPNAPGNVHGSPKYAEVRKEFGPRVEDLQFRYRDETGRWRGGLVVSDKKGRRPGGLLFQP